MTKPTLVRTPQGKTSSALEQTSMSGLCDRTAPELPNNRPVHRIRHGAISASIWQIETDKGPVFNVTFQRSYKDGDAWKTSTSFGRQNLLVLSLIAVRAFKWISNQTGRPRKKKVY